MLNIVLVIVSKPKSLVRILLLPWTDKTVSRNHHRFPREFLDKTRNLSVSDEGNVDYIPKCLNTVFIVTFGI